VRVVTRDDDSRTFVLNVRDATVQKDFYALEFDEGKDQVIESRLLGEIETSCAPALRRLVSGSFPPSQDDRELTSLFLAALWARGEDRIEQVEATLRQLAELTAVNITEDAARRAIKATQEREPTDDEVRFTVEYLSNPDNYRIKVDRNRVLQRAFEFDGAIPWFLRRQWILLRAGNAAFLSSDAPIALWSRPPFRPYGVGLATAEEIIFPVDRKHALVMVHESKHGQLAIDAPLKMVRKVNGCVAVNARRSIIHHPSDEPLEGIRLPPRVETETPRPLRIVPQS
jgi:hypothetical protein